MADPTSGRARVEACRQAAGGVPHPDQASPKGRVVLSQAVAADGGPSRRPPSRGGCGLPNRTRAALSSRSAQPWSRRFSWAIAGGAGGPDLACEPTRAIPAMVMVWGRGRP